MLEKRERYMAHAPERGNPFLRGILTVDLRRAADVEMQPPNFILTRIETNV
jgi:hypothetical protein